MATAATHSGPGRKAAFGLGAAVLAAALTAGVGPAAAQSAPEDPFEGFNRSMFAVHEGLDKAILEPVARGYVAITPAPVREGVGNVLDNLKAPVVLANDVLQLDPGRAASTTGRFLINSTLGLAGIFDVASMMGLEKHDEDFGQTLGKWGMPSGPYLFIPVLGPSSVRDGIGRGVDAALDPINDADLPREDETRALRGALTGLNTRADLLQAVEEMRAESDPYLNLRTTYFLLREAEIANGQALLPDMPDLPDLPPEGPGIAQGEPQSQINPKPE